MNPIKLIAGAFILLCCQLSSVNGQATPCITNFGQDYCSQSITILPAVIIKTSLSKSQLSTRLKRQVKQIAFLGQEGLFLVESKSPQKEAKKLSAQPDITYAQPDVMQMRHNNADSAAIGNLAPKIQELWKVSKGENVKIAIIDDGFNLQHPDLQGTHIAFQYDADSKNLATSPKQNLDRHGTQVAGVIFARHNGIGIDGIAPEASLIAIRQPGNRTSDTVLAFTVAAKAGADIINCSWNSPQLMEPVYDTVRELIESGREGKGVAIVFAAGNHGQLLKPFASEAAIPEAITVAANENYSNHGPLVDFYLSGRVKTTTVKGKYRLFGGTSALAPVISGLLALEMSHSPEKTTTQLVNELKKRLIDTDG